MENLLQTFPTNPPQNTTPQNFKPLKRKERGEKKKKKSVSFTSDNSEEYNLPFALLELK